MWWRKQQPAAEAASSSLPAVVPTPTDPVTATTPTTSDLAADGVPVTPDATGTTDTNAASVAVEAIERNNVVPAMDGTAAAAATDAMVAADGSTSPSAMAEGTTDGTKPSEDHISLQVNPSPPKDQQLQQQTTTTTPPTASGPDGKKKPDGDDDMIDDLDHTTEYSKFFSRRELTIAPNEFVRFVPYRFSWLRVVLFGFVVLFTGGLALVAVLWFPHLWTMFTKIRLPPSGASKAQYLLICIRDDGANSAWKQVRVHCERFPGAKDPAKAPPPSPKPKKVKDKDKKKKTDGTGDAVQPDLQEQLQDQDDEHEPVPPPVKEEDLLIEDPHAEWIWFEFRHQRYVYNHDKGEFERIISTLTDRLAAIQDRKSHGLIPEIVAARQAAFGRNDIKVSPHKCVATRLLEKLWHPASMLQILCAVLWIFESYLIYAIVCLCLWAICVASELVVEHWNNERLKRFLRKFQETAVRVRRMVLEEPPPPVEEDEAANGVDQSTIKAKRSRFKRKSKAKVMRPLQPPQLVAKDVDVLSTELVPGDIVRVVPGMVLVDMLVLSGGCRVDEEFIMGEKTIKRVTSATFKDADKAEVRHELLHKIYRPHLLCAGTTVLTIDPPQKAVAVDDKQIELEINADTPASPAPSTETPSASETAPGAADRLPSNNDGTNGDQVPVEEGTCIAVVVNTGFSTTTGEVVRSLMYPKPVKLDLEKDLYSYMGLLVLVGIGAFVKAIIDEVGVPDRSITTSLINALDMITIAVPPILSTIIRLCVIMATVRFHWMAHIHTFNTRRIHHAAQMDCMCFSKAGVLGESTLGFFGFDPVTTYEKTKKTPVFMGVKRSLNEIKFIYQLCFGTCHQLACDDDLKEESIKRLVHPDHLFFKESQFFFYTPSTQEVEKFKRRYQCYMKSQDGKRSFGIVRRFECDESTGLTTTLVEETTKGAQTDCWVFTKGPMHELAPKCFSTSLPDHWREIVHKHMGSGHQVYAFATRYIKLEMEEDVLRIKREHVEKNMFFMGLALFHNQVSDKSNDFVRAMTEARIDLRLVTSTEPIEALFTARVLELGLNSKTAVVDAPSGDLLYYPVDDYEVGVHGLVFSASNMSRIIRDYDFVITGDALELICEEFGEESVTKCIAKTRIFARLRSEQRAYIIKRLMDLGHHVGMCGQGAKDCFALQAAHVGFAIGDGIATSFSSFGSEKITDMMVLIAEARNTIETGVLVFKFLMVYPIIQLAMALLLSYFNEYLTNNQYVWDDIAIVLCLALFIMIAAFTQRQPHVLTQKRPPITLFHMSIVRSIGGQIVLFLAFYIGVFALVYLQSWFCDLDSALKYLSGEDGDAGCDAYLEYNTPDTTASYEQTVVWVFGHLQYCVVALAMHLRAPWIRYFKEHFPFLLAFAAVVACNLAFLGKRNVLLDTFEVMELPNQYGGVLFGFLMAQLLLAFAWELVVQWQQNVRATNKMADRALHVAHRQSALWAGKKMI